MDVSEIPLLAKLKPVVLGNDDYDDDLTYLKEVAGTEFSKNQDATLMNISSISSVQVTAENVNDLYNNIDAIHSQSSPIPCAQPMILHHGSPGGTTQDSIVSKVEAVDVNNLLSLLRTLPLTLSQGKDSMLNQRCAPGWSSSSSICRNTQTIIIISLFLS